MNLLLCVVFDVYWVIFGRSTLVTFVDFLKQKGPGTLAGNVQRCPVVTPLSVLNQRMASHLRMEHSKIH